MKTLEEQIQFNFNNEHNCIPVGFKRFAKFYPGIVRGTYTCITGSKDSAKTKLLYWMIMNVIEIVRKVDDPSKLDIKIFMFCLKQSKHTFKANLISAFLFRDHNIDIPFIELLSIPPRPDRKLTQAILDIIKTYDTWFEYFYSKVVVYDDKKKPSEIYDTVKKWLDNEAGVMEHDGDSKSFIYSNPNLFVLVCSDNINFLQSETDKGIAMDLRRCMDKHSVTNMTNLKNLYHCAIIDIHDQAVDKERLEHDFSGKPKEEKLEPSIDGLGDNKTNNRAYDFILGLHNPWRYEFPEHKGYPVSVLRDNYRSLKLLATLFGRPNVYLGMWFDGGTNHFEELPKKDDFKGQLIVEKFIKARRKE